MIFTFLKFEYSVYVGMSVNVIMEHTKKVVCYSFFSRTWEDGFLFNKFTAGLGTLNFLTYSSDRVQ